MKHVKLFENFEDSILVSEYSNFNGGPVWHVSPAPINHLEPNTPMWFALEYDHSLKGWYQNTIDANGEAYLYEAKVDGKIAIQGDPKVEEIFESNGLSLSDDYIADVIIQNPTSDELIEARGTKILQDAGYTGLIYYDYDPRDFDNDLEALIIFNTNEISDFRLRLTNTNEDSNSILDYQKWALLEYVVPMGISWNRWKGMRKKGWTPAKWHKEHPSSKFKIVHGHKKGKIGQPLPGATGLSYEKAKKMHAAVVMN